MSNYLKIIVPLLLCFNVSRAQDNQIQHVIKKGENVYRISLRYEVSMQEIFDLNPGSEELIKTGEILYIPKRNLETKITSNTSYEDYLVSKGETKYGISKSYGISIEELENANPFIKNGLQAGHRLKIPPKDNPEKSDPVKSQHVVKKGETLWGISKNYNLTLEDLIDLNRAQLQEYLQIGQVLTIKNSETKEDLKSYQVKKGDTKYGLSKQFGLSIPALEELNPQIKDMLRTGTIISIKHPTLTSNSDSTVLDDKTEEKPENNPELDTYVIKPKETLYGISKETGIPIENLIELNPKLKTSVLAGDIILLRKKSEAIDETTTVVNQPISEFSAEFIWVEVNENQNNNGKTYFSGLDDAITIATSNHQNINFNLNSLTKDEYRNFEQTNNSLARYRILQGAERNNTPLNVSFPITISKKHNGLNESIIVHAIPSELEMRKSIIAYLKEENTNIICLYDKQREKNIALLKEEIASINLMKLNSKNSFRTNKLEEKLKKNVRNYIIIESDKVGVFLNTTSFLLKKSSSFDIQLVVLNKAYIPDSSKISYNRFKVLKLVYPMPYNPNFLKNTSYSYRIAYMVNSDVINRLNSPDGLNSFKNGSTTTYLGTTFQYDLDNGIAKNKAVSIFMFTEESNSYLIGVY